MEGPEAEPGQTGWIQLRQELKQKHGYMQILPHNWSDTQALDQGLSAHLAISL